MALSTWLISMKSKKRSACSPIPGKSFRLAGLVIDAQHRVTKTGKHFGSFTMEDYSGKSEFILWSEDYARFSNYLEKGKNIFMTGFFKARYNRAEFEFKVDKMMLLESIKPMLTKQLVIDLEARHLNEHMVRFLEKNLRNIREIIAEIQYSGIKNKS